MIRFALLFTVLGAVFAFLAFSRGGVLPGIVFAICAIVPMAFWITMMVRNKRAPGAPLTGAAKGVLSAVAVVLVAALAYSVYWTFAVPKASKGELKYASELSKVCGDTYFPSAAKHTGSGPHPIIVFTKSGTSSSLQQVQAPYDAPAAWKTTDEKQIQLVACFDDVSSGERIGECVFTKGTIPVYRGRYKGSVVEAHTGKKVGDVSIDGSSEKDCPMMTMVKGDAEDNKLHTKPDFAELQKVLGRFVNG